jgi:hypothetical protein
MLTGVFPPCLSRQIDWSNIHITEFDFINKNDTEMFALPTEVPPQWTKGGVFHLHTSRQAKKVQIGFGGLGEEILKNLEKLPFTSEFLRSSLHSMLPL